MWTPDSAQVPLALIEAEMKNEVPLGTTAAAHAFMKFREENPKTVIGWFSLERKTAAVAWKFLETGQIVTGSSVTLTETSGNGLVVESLDKTNDTEENFANWLGTELTRYFPNASPFLPAILEDIVTKLDGDKEWATDIFLTVKGIQNVQKPTGMFIHHVRNVSRDEVAQKAAAERNKKPTTDDILDTVLAKAAVRMKDLPPPGPTEEEIQRRKAMNDAAEAQDWDDDGAE